MLYKYVKVVVKMDPLCLGEIFCPKLEGNAYLPCRIFYTLCSSVHLTQVVPIE